jgi:hypothetical protein
VEFVVGSLAGVGGGVFLRLSPWGFSAAVSLCAFLAGVEGSVEVGLLLLTVFVLLGRRAEWPQRHVDGLALRLGFVGGGSRW